MLEIEGVIVAERGTRERVGPICTDAVLGWCDAKMLGEENLFPTSRRFTPSPIMHLIKTFTLPPLSCISYSLGILNVVAF
jgi:hypothetical protein